MTFSPLPRPLNDWRAVAMLQTIVGMSVALNTRAEAGELASAEIPPPLAVRDNARQSRFYFSAGWQWRETAGVDVTAASRAAGLPLLPKFPASRDIQPPIGSSDEWADRFYNDGFVRMDAGTATDGTTSAWGYRSASQINGNELRYYASGKLSQTTSDVEVNQPKGLSVEGGGGAPVVEAGWERQVNARLSLGVSLAWSFMEFTGSQSQSNLAAWQRRDQFSLNVTDVYDLQGIHPPEAPYEGGGLGVGPLIDNLPASREESLHATDREVVHLFNTIQTGFEVRMNTVSLGPLVTGSAGPARFHGSAGIALNIVDWEANQTETLHVQRPHAEVTTEREWADGADGTDVLAGLFLQGGVSVEVAPRITFIAFGRYDWSDTLEEDFGLSTLRFDPSGWSAGILIRFNL